MRDLRTVNQLLLLCDHTISAIIALRTNDEARLSRAEASLRGLEEALIAEAEDIRADSIKQVEKNGNERAIMLDMIREAKKK